MKDFFKNFPYLEPPFGDVTYGIIFIALLFALGMLSGNDALGLVVAAIALGLLMLAGLSLQYMWQEKKKGVLWYLYTVILIISFLSYIPVILDAFKMGVSIWDNLILLVLSVFTPLFAFMVLLGKHYFSKLFWKLVFVSEFAILPFLLQKNISDVEMIKQIDISSEATAIAFVLYSLFMFPYLLVLYRYSFRNPVVSGI